MAEEVENDRYLDYELEYILAGRESDKGNLETVAKKLVMLRFVPNYIYLQTSSTNRRKQGRQPELYVHSWQSRLLQRQRRRESCLPGHMENPLWMSGHS